MIEQMQGEGELESWDRPGERFPCDYFFNITTNVLERPGFPRVTTHISAVGTVHSTERDIPQGDYRLFASDGEILKVRNLGIGEWTILAS